jgi:hypothetical protein
MNAADVLAQVVYTHRRTPGMCSCGQRLSAPTDSSHARHIGDLQMDALKAAGIKVVTPIKFSDLTDEEIDSMNAALNGDPT